MSRYLFIERWIGKSKHPYGGLIILMTGFGKETVYLLRGNPNDKDNDDEEGEECSHQVEDLPSLLVLK